MVIKDSEEDSGQNNAHQRVGAQGGPNWGNFGVRLRPCTRKIGRKPTPPSSNALQNAVAGQLQSNAGGSSGGPSGGP